MNKEIGLIMNSKGQITGFGTEQNYFFEKSQLKDLIIKTSRNRELLDYEGLTRQDFYVPHNPVGEKKYIKNVWSRMLELNFIQESSGINSCYIKPKDYSDERFLKVAACLLGMRIFIDYDLSEPEENETYEEESDE